MPALGERFRAAREARGLTLSDVSEQIRIRSVYLAAIEEENWTAIGAPVYVRGFLRTYARFLGLDPEEVVSAFATGPQPAGVPAAGERTPARSSSASAERGAEPVGGVSLMLWGAAIVAILLIAFVVYNEVAMRQAASVPIASVTEVPSVLPSNSGSPGADESALPSPAPGEDGAKSLALVLSAPSWLRVTVDGSVSMEGTFPAGTAKTFHGKNALVRIGNAGGVEIYVDGKDVGKLGKPGDVVEHAFTL